MSELRSRNEAVVDRIAVGVLYIFLERAFPSFPTSTVSHPSFWVVVDRNAREPLRSGDAAYFPFKVYSLEWKNAVEPVLADDTLKVRVKEAVKSSMRTHSTLNKVHRRDWDSLLARIKEALITSYQASGYLPSEGESPTPIEVGSEHVGDGEPINRTPWIPPEEKYPRYDT